MNRSILFLFILIIALTASLSAQDKLEIYFTQSVDPAYKHNYAQPIETGGELIKQRVLQMIDSARFTLDVCVYNNNESDITNALVRAVNRGVRVRYITDNSTSNQALKRTLPFSLLYTSSGDGIMHNKFIIKDATLSNRAEVMTGSMNLTGTGIGSDANNVLFILNSDLAINYQREFEEMWGSDGAIHGNSPPSGNTKTDNTAHQYVIAGIPIEMYFAPSDHTQDFIGEALSTANYSIWSGMYTLTSNFLTNKMINAYQLGVSFRGIVDNIGSSKYSLQLMRNAGMDAVEHSTSVLFHHKYCIIDADQPTSDPTVITGSYNWTFSAETINDENTLIIHDYQIAQLYQAEFFTRFCELKPEECAQLGYRKVTEVSSILGVITNDLIELPALPLALIDQYVNIQIVNSSGKPVLFRRQKITEAESVVVSIGAEPPGIYFLTYGNGTIQLSMKIIKS
ncbi:MAG TPA: phospholipase D-like domain-containing protein [Saprospiraceae bacterium]|nr:phospholipase D-like domain-containing protein [Saprospiraceae bacterium]HQW55377.1 phospholipase D-like domain-containing protein [Saprospiraceae bacterium]